MEDERHELRLGDVARIKHGFAFEGAYFVDGPTEDVLVTPGNFEIGGGFKLDKLKYYRGPVLDEYVLAPGDVVVTMTDLSRASDTLGYSALVPRRSNVRFLHNQRVGKLEVTRPDLVDKDFLYWLLRTPAYRAEILAGATGTAIKHTAPGRIETFRFTAPNLPEQREIARILGALDDKIDLNRKTNATLEAMARALYKAWFVDGPEVDWHTAPLAEWVDVLSGGTPSKSNAALWGGPLKWISPKAMTSIHADECDDHVSDQAVGNGTRIAPRGSTLVMVRGMGLHNGVRVSQAREDVTFNQDVKALVPKNIEADLLLFAMLDAQEELHKRVETSGHGTGKMPSEILLAHPITMPSREVQGTRAVHISALNDRIAANRSESRSLARIRDDLLPRLLSGVLSVDVAEREVEAVV